MDLGVRGRHAIVCGGSRGISRAAAFRLASEGARHAGGEDHRHACRGCCRRSAGHGQPGSLRCGRPHLNSRPRNCWRRVPRPISLLSPGTNRRECHSFASFQTLTRKDWDTWFDAHFFSAIDLIYAYVPGMSGTAHKSSAGSSTVSVNFIKFPQVNAGHSHAARLALAGAIAALVREVAPHNVSINSILPGLVDTEALTRTA